jgi:hypothetical protein
MAFDTVFVSVTCVTCVTCVTFVTFVTCVTFVTSVTSVTLSTRVTFLTCVTFFRSVTSITFASLHPGSFKSTAQWLAFVVVLSVGDRNRFVALPTARTIVFTILRLTGLG